MTFTVKFGAFFQLFSNGKSGSRAQSISDTCSDSASTDDYLNAIITDAGRIPSPLVTLDPTFLDFSPGSSSVLPDISKIDHVVQGTTTCLKVLKPLVGSIPIAGCPLKGVISSLLKLLEVYDQTRRNREDVADLRDRLQCLTRWLDMVPATPHTLFSMPNDYLRMRLCKTLSRLREVSKMPRFLSASLVKKEISRCAEDIDRALWEYMTWKMLLLGPIILDLAMKMECKEPQMANTFVEEPCLDIPVSSLSQQCSLLESAGIQVDARRHKASKPLHGDHMISLYDVRIPLGRGFDSYYTYHSAGVRLIYRQHILPGEGPFTVHVKKNGRKRDSSEPTESGIAGDTIYRKV